MKKQTQTTTDHKTIKDWAEGRGGTPSVVTENESKTEILRLNFPGYSGGDLQEISWDEWFRIFDENKLKLAYQEKTEGGEQSNFNKLVSRED